MEKSTKIIAGLAAAAIIIVGGLWLYMQSTNNPNANEQTAPGETQNDSTNIPASNAPSDENAPADNQQTAPAASENSASDTTATPPSDTSDTAIDKDISSVDSQVSNLSADSANIDKGLNDQPVAQGQ